jgi:nitrous oxidase accessory protein NosD
MKQHVTNTSPLRLKLAGTFIVALVTAAAARDFVVDIGHALADDGNLGTTERPWRSIQHAARQAQPGDTVRVMPGVYRESVTVTRDGELDTAAATLRFVAAGDAPAVLDGGVAVSSAEVSKTDVPNVFRWHAPSPLHLAGVNRPLQPVAWVWWEGKRLRLHDGKTPLGSGDAGAFTRHADYVLVNLGQPEWPNDQQVEVSFLGHGFSLRNVANVTVKGFELRRHAGNAIEVQGGSDCAAEDCHIVQPNLHGILVEKSRAVVARRNRIFEPNAWASNFQGQGHLVEENVFQTSGTRNERAGDAWVGVLKFNGGSYLTVRHNFLADRPPSEVPVAGGGVVRNTHVFGGIWGDIHCYDNRIYGNSVARQGHAGIYLEYLTQRATVMWNALQDNAAGISSRQSSGGVIRQNWIFDTRAVGGRETVDLDNMPSFSGRPLDHPEWGRERLDGICLWQTYGERPTQLHLVMDNLVQVTGRPVSVPVPSGMSDAVRADVANIMVSDVENVKPDQRLDVDYRSVANSFRTPLNNVVDRNLYVWSPASAFAGFAWFLDRQLESFDEYREATGFDAHGRLGAFTPADIGLRIGWTVQEGSRHPDLPLAFDHDGGAERAVPVGRAAFARGIWLDLPPEPYSWFRAAGVSTDPGPPPGGRAAHEPDWTRDARQWTQHPLCRDGVRGLAVRDVPVSQLQGLGWRTLCIPVSPGKTMRVRWHLKTTQVVAATSGLGIEVAAVFTEWTGHRPQRVFLVGNGARPELASGTYDWTALEQDITVPEGATRLIVYGGMKPASGTLLLDDFDISMQ